MWTSSSVMWTSFLGNVDVMARRWDLLNLKKAITRRGLTYSVIIPDVAHYLAKLDRENKLARAKSTRMDWSSYHDYDEVNLRILHCLNIN